MTAQDLAPILQDLALFALVCVSPAIVAVGMMVCGIALTRGVIQ